jgi:hypothetical protein
LHQIDSGCSAYCLPESKTCKNFEVVRPFESKTKKVEHLVGSPL